MALLFFLTISLELSGKSGRQDHAYYKTCFNSLLNPVTMILSNQPISLSTILWDPLCGSFTEKGNEGKWEMEEDGGGRKDEGGWKMEEDGRGNGRWRSMRRGVRWEEEGDRKM